MSSSTNKTITVPFSSFAAIGVVLAMQLSYEKWHSIGWECVAGIFGWVYCLYYWLVY